MSPAATPKIVAPTPGVGGEVRPRGAMERNSRAKRTIGSARSNHAGQAEDEVRDVREVGVRVGGRGLGEKVP